VNPWVLLAGLLAVLAAAGGAYVQGRADGRDACQAAEARDQHVATVASAAAAASAAEAIAKLEVKHVTVRQKLEREVVTKEVFRDCRSGPDALRLFNDSIPPTGTEPSTDRGKLPAANPAD